MIPTFKLLSAATNANAPFSFGHPFKRGDVPAGSTLVADIADFQCTHKNTWPDGSLKFAILSGRASLVADVEKTVVLSLGAPVAGTDLTIADLKATTPVAIIGAGAFGSATWETTDWDTPFDRTTGLSHAGATAWVSGPKMSSWVYRKQIASDPHLVAWVRVRLWAGGEVEILPWVENGYFKVAAPGSKADTFTFHLNTVSKFSQALEFKHHTRTPLINGAHLGYWLGTDPGVTPIHDKAYFQATEVVPSYRAQPATASLVTLPSTYAPFQIGGFTYGGDSMPSGGYQRPIGLLPEHDVAFLTCVDNPQLLYAALIRNGFSAGRYPIHYRDENTNRIPAFTTHQSTVLGSGSNVTATGDSSTGTRLPTNTGSAIAGWDTAHSPALVGAYLVTGDWYHMETAQFAVATDWFNIDDINSDALNTRIRFYPRNGAVQTRQVAWGIRALAHALLVTPDNDTLVRGELRTLFEQITDFYHQIYIAQPNNPFGIVQLGEYYPVLGEYQATGGTFQQDFMTATFGYAICMGLPLSASTTAKLAEFFQWKARSVVGRLGTSEDYWYVNAAAAFYFAVSTVARPDFKGGTGPWPADWKEIYDATMANTGITWESNTEGVLGAEFTSDTWTKGQLANLQPAIAYAVRHGVPGARAGYDRMVNATNFNVLDSGFDTRPVWSVLPYEPQFTVGKTIRCDSISLIPGMVVCGDRGLGLLGSTIRALAASGEHGPGFGVPSIADDELEYEIRFELIDPPAGLVADEATRVTYSGPTTSFSFRKIKAGVEDGIAVATLNMGTVLVGATFAQSYQVKAALVDPGEGDTQNPMMVGEITVDLVTANIIGFSCQPATDNVGVTSYQYSIDGGANFFDNGTARNVVKGDLPDGTSFVCMMRARDQAGNVSAPISKTISTLPGEVVAPPSVNQFKTPTTGQYATRTYGWLVAMVADWLHRDNLAARIPEFIMLAEAEINRKLGLVPRDVDVALTVPRSTRFIARPTDMGYPIALWSDIHQPRIQLNAALASSLNVDSNDTPGEPSTWAIDGWAIAFDRIADRDYPITFRYRQDNTLSETNPTNEILVRSPDVYLYGSLAAAAPYMRDDDRTLMWESKFKRALAEVKIEASRTSATAPLRTEVPCSFLAR